MAAGAVCVYVFAIAALFCLVTSYVAPGWMHTQESKVRDMYIEHTYRGLWLSCTYGYGPFQCTINELDGNSPISTLSLLL